MNCIKRALQRLGRPAAWRARALVFVVLALVLPLLEPIAAHASTLTGTSFTVMDPRTSIPGNRYDWGFTSASTSTLSRVTMGVPPATTGANRYLTLPGISGNYASTPSSTPNSTTGDMDVRVEATSPNWYAPSTQMLASKRDTGLMSWSLAINSSNYVEFITSTDGSTYTFLTLPVPTGLTANTPIWFRATRIASSGVEAEYYSTDGTNWNLIGSATKFTGALYNTTADVEIGAYANGAAGNTPNNIYYSDVRSAVAGTTSPSNCGAANVVVCFNPNNDTIGGLTWAAADTTGETWTVNRSGSNLPADVASDLSVMNISGLPSGGKAQNREIDGTAAYVLPTPTSVAALTAIKLGLAGFTNTISPAAYTSAITTYDNSTPPTAIDSATTPSITLTDPTITTSAGMANVYPTSAGPTATSSIVDPEGIAVNGTTVYVSDVVANTVDAVDTTSGLVTRFAGNGTANSSGDGGAATAAGISLPENLTFDSSGNMYVAERFKQVLRKITTGGTISRAAGASVYNFSGDGGDASTAGFRDIVSTAFNAAGDLFIVDRGNCRIRKVDHSTNVITTVVGNGSCTYGGDGGTATSASINQPSDVAFDSAGNMYIADTGNNRIREVDTSGNISSVAGTGSPGYTGDGVAATTVGLANPIGVALDSAGNIYISDSGNNRIRKINTSGIISTFAGTGTYGFSGDGAAATSAAIAYPVYLKVDASGNVYFTDHNNFRVRKINTSGTISTIFGNGVGPSSGDGGPATSASFYNPGQMTADSSGNVYVADTASHTVRKIDQWGTITTIAGKDVNNYGSSGDNGPATSALLNQPKAVAIASSGTIYIADYGNNKIRAITGGTISTLATLGGSPSGVAVNPITQDIWATTTDCRITKITSGGATTVVAGNGSCSTTGDGASASSATVNNPTAIAFNSAGDAYYIDNYSTIRKISATTGNITTVAGNGGLTANNAAAVSSTLGRALALTVDATGKIYVATQYIVRSFTDGGPIQSVAGVYNSAGYSGDGQGGGNVRFTNTDGITISQGNLLIADSSANNIRKIANVSPVAPLVNNDAMSVPMNNTRPWPILSNDWSQTYEMDPSSVTVVTAPTHGSVSISNPTTEATTLQANYTPTTGYTGSDSYVYQACDTTRVLCNTATVSITVGSNQVMTIAGGPAEGYASQIGFSPAGGARFRNYLFYTDSSLGLLRRYDIYSKQSVVVAGNAIAISSDGIATASGIPVPTGIATTPDGSIYMASTSSGKVRTLSPTGALGTLALGLTGINAVGFGRDGTLYETQTGYVKKWNGSAFVAFVGTGTVGGTGNGSAATSALVNTPYGIVGASNGDIYFSDSTDCTIRKVNTSGIIFAVAGTSGTCSLTGDGGAATAATLGGPRGIAFNSNGALLVASNYAIRSINASAIITSLATGISPQAPTFIAPGATTDFFVFDPNYNKGYYVSTAGSGSSVLGTGALNYSPDGANPFAIDVTAGQSASSVAVDGLGNLYFSEPTSSVIRRMNLSTGAITTVVNTYAAWAIAIDSSNRLVFADFSGCRVWRQNADLSLTLLVGTGTCSTTGDTGLATAATINKPGALTYDSVGNLYVAENTGQVVRKVNTSGYISTVAGKASTTGNTGDGGLATAATLNTPGAMAVDRNGNLLIVDTANYRVRMVDRNGIITNVAGTGTAGFSGDAGLATNAAFGTMRGIAVDNNNNIFISDTTDNRIREIAAATGVITTIVGTSTASFIDNTTYGAAGLNFQGPITFDLSGNLIFQESNNRRIRQVTGIGATSTDNLSSTAWTVNPINTGHLNLRERFVATPSVSTTSSKMTFTMPTSVAGSSLTVVSKYGVTGATTAVLSGTTLTVSYPSQTLTAGVPVGFAVEGWTNGGANGSYASYVTEYDSAGTTAIGWAHSNVVNITSSGAPTVNDAGFASVWQRSLTATNSTTAVSFSVNPSATPDNNTSFSLATLGNLTSNTTSASATSLTGTSGTIGAITSDLTTGVASASFTTNKWGVQIVSGGGTAQGASGSGTYTGLSSTLAAAVATAPTGNTVTFTPRAKVNYLVSAGTYGNTFNWQLTPGY